MAESRMDEVAQELLRKSKDGKLQWEESGKRGSYRVIFPDVVLAISRDFPTEEDSDLTLELISEAGRVIDSLETTPEDPMHSTLSQMFDLAQQGIRDSGIDKALDYLKRT